MRGGRTRPRAKSRSSGDRSRPLALAPRTTSRAARALTGTSTGVGVLSAVGGLDLSEQPNHLLPRLRIHRQHVDDVGPIVASPLAGAEQVRGDRVAVGLVVDLDAAGSIADLAVKGREHSRRSITTHQRISSDVGASSPLRYVTLFARILARRSGPPPCPSCVAPDWNRGEPRATAGGVGLCVDP